MLLATIGLMGAATTHLPLIGRISPIAFLLVQDSLIAAGIGYDMLSRRRVHHTYLWGGALIIASQFLIRSAPAMSGVPATG
jgi:hypothetical protein